MARFDLTDFEWSVIEPLLPTKGRGVALWADIPTRYEPHTPCVNRFNRWRRAGHWARILEAVSAAYRATCR